jgi:hypothetical protein
VVAKPVALEAPDCARGISSRPLPTSINGVVVIVVSFAVISDVEDDVGQAVVSVRERSNVGYDFSDD